jgi:type I site-specific restriction endonuclease
LTALDKKSLSEIDICDLIISPAIRGAGWDPITQIRRDVTLTPGPVVVRGNVASRNKKKKKFADYVLYREPGVPIAVVEAKDNHHTISQGLQQALGYAEIMDTGLKNVRLIDSHSFCWIFATLLKQESEGTIAKVAGSKDSGRILGGREKSIIAMRLSIENTVKNSNGQIVQRAVKNKETSMTPKELEALIESLLDIQENRCALTGIAFQFHGQGADKNLLPSVDRIDSNGHYEVENLQVVCQFINFWKGSSENEDFKRLLMLVRGVEAME